MMDSIKINEFKEYYKFLFELQFSGRTNMFGATPYLVSEMGLEKKEAREVLSLWMQNYQEIAKELGIEV